MRTAVPRQLDRSEVDADGEVAGEEFAIEFAIPRAGAGDITIYTAGLHRLDLPELHTRVDFEELAGLGGSAGLEAEEDRLFFIAQGLVILGRQLIKAGDPADVVPQRLESGGHSARFELGRECLPRGTVAVLLPGAVDSVCEVTLSAWRRSAPPGQ